LLERLAAQGYLDDARFAEGYCRARRRRGIGSQRLVQELVGRGVEPALARQFALADEAEETARAAELARACRQRGKTPQQIYRFLLARGFAAPVARSACGADEG
jgi:regulatory protein